MVEFSRLGSPCNLENAELGTFLSHVVGNGEILSGPEKVWAITEYPRPWKKRSVHSFLGLVGYYWKYVPHFSTIAGPLTDVIKKSVPTQVEWTNDCESSFAAPKEALIHGPVLKSPDFDKMFIVQCDACDNDIGTVVTAG